MNRSFFAVIAASAIVLLVTGCQKKDDSPTTFTTVYQVISATGCIECHKPSGSATVSNNVQLDFTTQALAYSTLLASTVNGITATGSCPGVRVVSAGNPPSSYLLAMVNSAYRGSNFAGVSGCTPYDHSSKQNLSTEQQDALISWISDGAKNN